MFGFFDVIQDILSNLRTFGLRDVIDIAVVSLDQLELSIGKAYRRNGRCPLKFETYPPKLKI